MAVASTDGLAADPAWDTATGASAGAACTGASSTSGWQCTRMTRREGPLGCDEWEDPSCSEEGESPMAGATSLGLTAATSGPTSLPLQSPLSRPSSPCSP